LLEFKKLKGDYLFIDMQEDYQREFYLLSNCLTYEKILYIKHKSGNFKIIKNHDAIKYSKKLYLSKERLFLLNEINEEKGLINIIFSMTTVRNEKNSDWFFLEIERIENINIIKMEIINDKEFYILTPEEIYDKINNKNKIYCKKYMNVNINNKNEKEKDYNNNIHLNDYDNSYNIKNMENKYFADRSNNYNNNESFSLELNQNTEINYNNNDKNKNYRRKGSIKKNTIRKLNENKNKNYLSSVTDTVTD
jgi:hypothetical protein